MENEKRKLHKDPFLDTSRTRNSSWQTLPVRSINANLCDDIRSERGIETVHHRSMKLAFPRSMIHELSQTIDETDGRSWRGRSLLGASGRAEIMSSRKFPPVVDAHRRDPLSRLADAGKFA
jgi:hypothetical protein